MRSISYLLTVIWKDICQEDLPAPSTRLLRTVLNRRRKHKIMSRNWWEHWITFFILHALQWISTMLSFISFLHFLLLCTETQQNEAHLRNRLGYHFSLCYFLLFYALIYFSPGEFSSFKSLRIIHWHQRGSEWDCASVWCSPRIACV